MSDRSLFLMVLEAGESEVRSPADWVSAKGLPQMAVFHGYLAIMGFLGLLHRGINPLLRL